ncbi:major facilitator superfamily domain-containing protein 1-like [Limulus polyphemus]|uniref:Lysosomal dipeptide transporter MFSD1 n=1 Tax=Limulus polyphemus TaxID=6850 RepID=A0ABM1SRR8_LIMPO|nr:major facilitator superfamily domain-containing protein 1-like [Limulus polyphemus]
MALLLRNFLASASCILSQISAFILGFFDWRAEKILNRAAGKTGEVVVLKDVLQFPASFWLISLICVTYYVAIFPFIGLGSVFFMRKFEFSPTMANNINGIVYIVSAGASPVLGLLIDKTGRHLTWVFVSVILTLGMHALLAFSFLNPWIAMVIMGFAYSMLASGLWPMVALIIPEHQLGTAYGIMQSVQNLGLGVITILAGLIVDKKGYLVLETFFLGWLCCSLLSVVVLYIINSKNNGDLDLSVSKRIEREQHRNFQKVMTAPLLQ